jgi:hypothetical protein
MKVSLDLSEEELSLLVRVVSAGRSLDDEFLDTEKSALKELAEKLNQKRQEVCHGDEQF